MKYRRSNAQTDQQHRNHSPDLLLTTEDALVSQAIMGQSASAYDEGDNYSDEEGDGSYYSSSDEYSDDEEGYESGSSSVMSSRGPTGSDKRSDGDRREVYETHHRAQDASVADEQHRAQATDMFGTQ